MAKDVITRFKLETTGFDSKIKQAAKDLSAYSKTATQAKEGFDKFTKSNIDAAKALGTIATSTTNAKDRAKELVGAFNDAAKAYNSLTKEQQQSDWAKALAGSLTQLQQRIKETKQEMQSMGNVSKNMGGGFSGVMGNMSKVFGVSPAMLTGIGAAAAAFTGLKEVIGGNISTAIGFEKSMSQLSSLTGMVGKDLEKLKEYAIDLGSTSTLTASQVADAFRLIGSQQPQLLSSGEALKEVTKYAITLSEAAGIDLQTAAQTLSTSINQMGGDSNNAARYVNVLAAASQKGAGDIAWLGEAITKSATAAKAVGTDYEELVANLEQLAKAGFDASTAGTALRSIIMNLEKQANNEFKPSVVGLTQAFENLGKANLDIVGYQEIAGKMFASQAMALANASQEAKKMTEAITGTNIAEAQAKTNTDNLDGALKSLASAWEGLNLHINSSNGLLKAFVDWCTNVIRDLDNMTTSAGRAKKALQELNGSGNGQPSKVDRQINALRGSKFKQQKYNSTLGQYDHDIKVAEYYKKKYKEAGWAGGSVLSDITRRFGVNMRGEEDIDNLINNLKTLREDYKRRAEKILNSTAEADNGKGKGGVVLDVDADTEEATKSIKELQGEIKKLKKLRDDAANAGNTKLRDQYNTQIKSVQAQIKAMRGTGSTTTKNLDDEQKVQKKINDLLKEALTADANRQGEIRQQVAELQKQQEKYKDIKNIAQGILPKDKEAVFTIDGQLSEETKKNLRDIENVTIDDKTMTVTANTQEAMQKVQELIGQVSTATLQVKVKTDGAPTFTMAQLEGMSFDNQIPTTRGNRGRAQDKLDLATAAFATGGISNIDFSTYISGIKNALSNANLGDELYNNMTEKLKDATTVSTLLQEMMERGLAGADLESTAQALKEKLLSPEGIDQTAIQSFLDTLNEQIEEAGGVGLKLNADTGEVTDDKEKGKDDGKELKKFNEGIGKLSGGLSQVTGGLKAVGIEIPEEVDQVIGVINGVSQIISGVGTIISVFQTSAITANTIALGALTSAVTANTVAKFIPFLANGGVVPAFAQGGTIPKFADGRLIGCAALGMTIPGNSMSGDRLRLPVDGGRGMIGVNSGELILNKSSQNSLAADLLNAEALIGSIKDYSVSLGNTQQAILAQELEGNSRGGYNSQPYLDGELIYLGLQAYLRRSGKGEIVTANR